jgi:hypothetical protein
LCGYGAQSIGIRLLNGRIILDGLRPRKVDAWCELVDAGKYDEKYMYGG